MYKEIKNLPVHFLIEEAWLGCSEFFFSPLYGKIGIPQTEHRTETRKAMESLMTVCFSWEKLAPVLESFFALEMVNMVFYCPFFLVTPVLVRSQ
jgi:hypothetical protein